MHSTETLVSDNVIENESYSQLYNKCATSMIACTYIDIYTVERPIKDTPR